MYIHSIELTNKCNLRCEYCPSSVSPYPKGLLDIEQFLMALEYALPGFGLSMCGEPLLHPDVCAFIKIARKMGKDPGINTNGLVLNHLLICKLIEAGLTHMEISIHNSKCLDNYRLMQIINDDHGSPIRLQGNILSCNEEAFKTWDYKGLKGLKVQSVHNWATDTPSEKDNRHKCVFFKYGWCSMRWDGRLVTCCFDFDGENTLGWIGDIKRAKDYKDISQFTLCKKCSPAWVTGVNDIWREVNT